jgi:hypothetical protein
MIHSRLLSRWAALFEGCKKILNGSREAKGTLYNKGITFAYKGWLYKGVTCSVGGFPWGDLTSHLRFRASGFGIAFTISGFGFRNRIYDFGLRVSDLIYDFGLRVSHLRFRASCFGPHLRFRASGITFSISGFGFREQVTLAERSVICSIHCSFSISSCSRSRESSEACLHFGFQVSGFG